MDVHPIDSHFLFNCEMSTRTEARNQAMDSVVQIMESKADARVRRIKTCVLLLSKVMSGIVNSIPSPTLLDLKLLTHSSLPLISLIFPAKSVGAVIGSILLTVVYSRCDFQFSSSLALILCAGCMFAVPFMTQIWSQLLVNFLGSIFLTVLDAGAYSYVAQLWGSESGLVMQAVVLMLGVGNALAPIIAGPFLVYQNDTEINPVNNITASDAADDLQLVYPYSILSALLTTAAVACFVTWIISPVTKEHPTRKQVVQSQETDGQTVIPWRKTIIFCVMMTMFFLRGLEYTSDSFLMTFAVDSDLQMRKESAVLLLSVVGVVPVALKILFLILFKWTKQLTSKQLMLFCVVNITISNLILMPFGDKREIGLWIGIVVLVLGKALFRGSVMTFAEEAVSLTGRVSGLIFLASCVGSIVFSSTISTLIETNPRVFLWTNLMCSLAVALFFMASIFITRTTIRRCS